MAENWTEERFIDEIKRIVNESYGLDLSDKDGDSKIADLGLDSMGVLDVVMSLEDLTGHKFEEINLPKNPSLRDVAALALRSLSAE